MRLRQLRIKGFKSFANDTIINFNEDVIGIVGPNGSGKSNVVDAISWVLGEQKTKELRLEKMTDVIFNGTKTRKKSGVAQVTLNFENSKNILPVAYNNVSISRFLYRSGESEYRLNNVPCRLKDIQNLFRDTGIGSNSYAILALGMVDDLLADKENARRRMFEQAAGISKFKNRKKETLNKLKATTSDLDRVEDLLFEIETNIKALERQARRAKKYLKLKESYRTHSIQLAHLTISDYKEQYKALEAKITKDEDHYRETEVKQRTLEAIIAKIQKKNLDEEVILSQKQKHVNQIVNEIREEENKKGILNQKKIFSEQNINANQIAIERDKESLKKFRDELKSLTTIFEEDTIQVDQQKKILDKYKLEYEDLKQKYEKSKEDSNQRIAKENELRQQIFDTEKKKAVFQNNIDNLHKTKQIKIEEVSKLQITRKAVKTQLKQVQSRLSVEIESLDKIKNKAALAEKTKSTLEESIQLEQKKLERVHRNLDAKQNEHNLLKSMIDNLEGYPESIKYLNKNWNKKVPILSDLINCDDSYRNVLEQYLDSYLNHFVVSNTSEAVQAIELLSEGQKGKAQFFLLDSLKTIKTNTKEIPFSIPARTAVSVEKDYKLLFDLLLHNVYFTDNDAMLLEHHLPEDIVLLSKHGIMTRSKHILSGGSMDLFGGKKIGRKKHLKKLEKLIKSLHEETKSSEKSIRKLNESLDQIDASSIKQETIDATHTINELEREYYIVENRKKNTEEQLKGIQIKIEKEGEQIDTLQKNLQLENKNLSKQKDAFDLLAQIKNTSGALDTFSKNLSIASEQYNTANVNFIRQENKINNVQKDILYRNDRIEEINSKLDQLKILISNDTKSIDRIKLDIEQIEITLQLSYKKKLEREKELTGVEQMYFSERQKVKTKEDEHRNISRSLQTQQLAINQQKETYNDIKFKLQSVNERLKIEFQIAINDIINDKMDITLNKEELSQKVFSSRTRIEGFGEVNPMAVEAYDEMKNRHETITNQRNDILEARKSLESTIKEIETEATKAFMTAFTQIRTHFIKVFRTLFTENDTCDLILVDENNPLDSKIEIIAKPKGKRPQSLSQLSGGEKTLTATALLFALYLLKPAPFCIFDEIDAPLDDINIQKFNKLIRQFSIDSQFIIITHNKDTMAELGTMYGIYMQEQGVSGISLVDFRALVDG